MSLSKGNHSRVHDKPRSISLALILGVLEIVRIDGGLHVVMVLVEFRKTIIETPLLAILV